MRNISNHFGIYGVCIENEKILVINKNRGPYNKRYDLPGGSQEGDESLIETLIREVKEETGYDITEYKTLSGLDFFVQNEGGKQIVHHIAIIYEIEINNKKRSELETEVIDGKNDSIGCKWISFKDINIVNSSPLLLDCVQYLQNKAVKKRSEYLKWKVLI